MLAVRTWLGHVVSMVRDLGMRDLDPTCNHVGRIKIILSNQIKEIAAGKREFS